MKFEHGPYGFGDMAVWIKLILTNSIQICRIVTYLISDRILMTRFKSSKKSNNQKVLKIKKSKSKKNVKVCISNEPKDVGMFMKWECFFKLWPIGDHMLSHWLTTPGWSLIGSNSHQWNNGSMVNIAGRFFIGC